MTELFGDDAQGDQTPPERNPSRRSRALIITAVVLVVAFFALSTFASVYTDHLWFDAVGYGGVWSRLLLTRLVLFVVFGVLMAAVVVVNVVVAFRTRPLFHPPSAEQNGLDRYRQAITPIRTWLVAGLAVVLGIFAGTSGAGTWRTYMLWRNGVPFGTKDQYFGKDIGFFVFDLPWYHYLVNYVMAVLAVALLAAALVHYLYGGIRLQSPGDRLSGSAQAQLSVLLGIFVLFKALDYWLDRYDLAVHTGSLLTGITYTSEHAVLPSKSILMGISVICALLFFLNVWRRTWMLPSVGLALLVLSAIILGLIWPGIVQQLQVNPTPADKEAPYIAKNIAATRAAYDINSVQEYQRPATDAGAAGATAADPIPQANSLPLVDPSLVTEAFDQNQQVRSYYAVPPVLDVDHYVINGVDRAVVLGARELYQDGIDPSDRNWSNLHTTYTHGSGLIAAFANQRDPDDNALTEGATQSDRTQWAEGNQADQNYLTEAVGCFRNSIYYGENSPDYAVVGKPSAATQNYELDLKRAPGAADPSLPCEGDRTGNEEASTTTYAGPGGVGVGSTFRQLLYAMKFGTTNFLLSGRVNANSKVLYNRNPAERVRKVAPWLTLDDDVYPVAVDGKVLWVLDGYTTTDRYPGSERTSYQEMTTDSLQNQAGLRTLPTDQINYMRNAVKATVDAYTGQVTLYAWDTTDPILKAWSAAFPGTVEPRSDIPTDLLPHLRYPEDYFKAQRYQFARYHVTDPGDWFQGNQRWAVPTDPSKTSLYQPPYRLFVSLPKGLRPESADGSLTGSSASADYSTAPTWSLTSTFVPYQRNLLAAYVAVDSDATSSTYGQIRVIDVQDQQQQGPAQIFNTLRSDPQVADSISAFSKSGGQPTYGNLLTIPVGNQQLYVEPVYAQVTSGSSYPILRYVLVYYDNEVGIGSSLSEALQDAISSAGSGGGSDTGSSSSPSPTTGSTSSPSSSPTSSPGGGTATGTAQQQVRQLLADAQQHFQAADQALTNGDLGTYSAQIKAAQSDVNQALSLSGQRAAGSATPSASATPRPSAGASSRASSSPTPTASASASGSASGSGG